MKDKLIDFALNLFVVMWVALIPFGITMAFLTGDSRWLIFPGISLLLFLAG